MKIATALLVFPAAIILVSCLLGDAVPRIEEKNLNIVKLTEERFEQVDDESSLNTQRNFRQLWNNFKDLFNKSYFTAEEELQRFQVFIENYRKIKQHNDEFLRGKHTYSLAVNQFADMTRAEFSRTMNGVKRRYGDSLAKQYASTFLTPMNLKAPDEVDWRQHGYVTPIKDQSLCGSCWAFSATGALEGQHFRKTGKLVSLSEQNLIDCSKDFYNNGCEGGWVEGAFVYVNSNGGIDTESSYPYQAQDRNCRFKRSDVGAIDTGFTWVAFGDENKLKEAVASVGPVSVSIDASHESFQHYKNGVYNEPDCSSTQLDHAVLVVGYGTTTDGTDYWIVKNSWNTTWGDQGYIKMARNRHNQCGIATDACYPLV